MDGTDGKIRCFINARFLTQATTGVQRTGIETVKALDVILGGHPDILERFTFTMLAPANIRRELGLKNIPLRCVGRLRGHLWEQFELPWYTRGGLLVNLGNVAPLVKRDQIVTIYDASIYAAGDTYSFAFRTWYKVLYPRLGRVSRRVFTISEFSKRELMRYAGIPAEKMIVVSCGREHVEAVEADEAILDKLPDPGKPFLLAVSSMSPNKNFRAIIQAIELLGEREFGFVIAGGTNPRIFAQQDISLPKSICYLGYVSDSALKALYGRAAGFVFPSTYEGFGLPPLEAMTCGCPVILSWIPPLREVFGDAALYCDPGDPGDIADKMCELVRNEGLRQRLIKKGRERSRRYSWEKTAKRYLEELAQVTGVPTERVAAASTE